MTVAPALPPPAFPGRSLFRSGIALAVTGIVLYVIQIAAKKLSAPWYLPVATTLGLIFVIGALSYRRSAGRWIALVLLMLFAGGEWAFLLGTRLPPYSGPVAVGKPFPPFQTLRADGAPFKAEELMGSKETVMVFFRGRW